MNKFQINKQEYNDEPVEYCNGCLSLRIKSISSDIPYCCDCGDTDINKTSIIDWEKLYKNRYNKSFIEN